MATPPVTLDDNVSPPAKGSVNEKLIDLFMEHAIDLLRFEFGTRQRILVILRQLEVTLVGFIRDVDPTAPSRVLYQRRRLEKLLTAVRGAIKGAYRDSSALMAQEVREVVDIEAAWLGRAINAVTKVEFVDAGLTREAVETLVSDVLIQGAPTADWWARQSAGLVNRFADEMRIGIGMGENNDQLVARVQGLDGEAGLMDTAYNSAERLVRSSVQTAANVAREAVYDKNTDLIKALLWHATLDLRTSFWCIARDSKQYTPVDHQPIGHDIPWLQGPGKLHWCCRSTSVPILKSFRELGIDADEVPETTRASMDGQVPAELSFEDWLRKQSAARQDTVLGSTAADLWRRGKIQFRDLLNQQGRPLTVEELRAKAGAA